MIQTVKLFLMVLGVFALLVALLLAGWYLESVVRTWL